MDIKGHAAIVTGGGCCAIAEARSMSEKNAAGARAHIRDRIVAMGPSARRGQHSASAGAP